MKRNDIGKRLRFLRKQTKLGIKSVARQVDVDYSYLSKIENGHKAPSPELAKKLCDLYGGDFDEIAARLGEMPDDVRRIIEAHGKEVFELLRSRYSKRP
jgi:transcriptional regulator with XRE-family HTH domain